MAMYVIFILTSSQVVHYHFRVVVLTTVWCDFTFPKKLQLSK